MAATPVLFFDLDGTLIDPIAGIDAGIRHAFTTLGEEPPSLEQVRACIGPPLAESLGALLGDARAALVGDAVRLFRERYGEYGLLACSVYPRVHEALGAARAAGFRSYIVTSKPRPFAERIAAAHGLDAHLDGVYGSELDGRFGDKAVLLRHVVETEGVAGAPAAMIGDRHHDVRAAQAVGIRAIGVTYGYGTPHELLAAGADVLCASADDLVPAAQRLLG